MENSLQERLQDDRRTFDYHDHDMEAFNKMEYVAPFVFDRELWVEKLMYGNLASIQQYFIDYWQHSVVISIVYVIVTFGLKKYMSNKKRFELQTPLFAWSLILAVFSIIGTVRTIGEAVQMGVNRGVYYLTCYPSIYYGSTGFWSLVFVLSKVVELGDTIFIVLRKQPLIFLHWYHHWTVLVFSFFTYSQHSGAGRWFCVMNYVVHSFMYTYYALRAAKITVPRIVNILITTMQIVQMFIGTAVCVYAYYLKSIGTYCYISFDVLHCGLLIYITYFILFGNYFYNTYLVKGKQPPRKSSTSQNGDVTLDNKHGAHNGVSKGTVSNGNPKLNGVHNGHVSNGTVHSEKSTYANGFSKKDE